MDVNARAVGIAALAGNLIGSNPVPFTNPIRMKNCFHNAVIFWIENS